MSSSDGYANRLAKYNNKGHLNLAPAPDAALAVLHKARILADRLKHAAHPIAHTGAGISTSAGIPDFRGPEGIWTQQRRERRERRSHRRNHTSDGNTKSNSRSASRSLSSSSSSSSESSSLSPSSSPPRKRPRASPPPPPLPPPKAKTVSFEEARPALAHVAITALHGAGLLRHVISQNVDGLHLRAGLPRRALSELHGNLFVDWCAACGEETARDSEAATVGFRPAADGRACERCGGALTDKALDWEDALPEPDFGDALRHAAKADLHVVAGTSCQMNPARNLPFRGKRGKRAAALVNLSKTTMDDRFGLIVRAPCDAVFAAVAVAAGLRLPPFQREVTLLVEAAQVNVQPQRAPVDVRCSALLRWDGKFIARRIPGVRAIAYHVVDGGGSDGSSGCPAAAKTACRAGGYEAVLRPRSAPTTLQPESHAGDRGNLAQQQQHVVAVTMQAEDGTHVDLGTVAVGETRRVVAISEVFDAQREARRLHHELQAKAEEEQLDEECADQFFVTAAKAGRVECVTCGQLVPHARSVRLKHFTDCCADKMSSATPEAGGQIAGVDSEQRNGTASEDHAEVKDVDALYGSD